MEGLKYKSREFLKTIFFVAKETQESRQGLHEIFFNLHYKCTEVLLSPISKSTPYYLLLIFFEECLNPQVRINKMANEHTIDYRPSLSELTSRLHPLIFLWIPKGFISPEYFLSFSQTCISLTMVLNSLCWVKKFVHFCSCLQATLPAWFLSPPLQAEENYPFLPNVF